MGTSELWGERKKGRASPFGCNFPTEPPCRREESGERKEVNGREKWRRGRKKNEVTKVENEMKNDKIFNSL
jgi:hypothetical protein